MSETDKDTCPHCGSDLMGTPIPKDDLHLYNPLDWDPTTPPPSTHFRRVIGVELQGVYDGILYWKCPDCEKAWNRWPPTDYRWLTADTHTRDNNERIETARRLGEKHVT